MIKYDVKPAVIVSSIDSLPEIIGDRYKNILILSSPTVFEYVQNTGVVSRLGQRSQVQCFSRVEPNAPLVGLDEIKRSFKKPSLILAIGGGSTIDTAKALSVTWDDLPSSDYFYKKVDLSGKKIHTIAVPSTAGTGAELSYGAILEDTLNNVKGGLRGELIQPNEVLIDVELYKLAPARLLAETGFDCLTHAVETYLSTSSSPLVRYQSISAINTVFNFLPKAVKEKNTVAIQNMALASCMMGINLAKSSTCLPHRIQYVIGPATSTSHAQGLIMLYKGWLPLAMRSDAFGKLAYDLGVPAEDLVNSINSLKRELDIDYTLSDYNISTSSVEILASKVTGNVANDPIYKDISTIEKIIIDSIN